VGPGIRDSIRQSKPFPSLESETAVALQRTAGDLVWHFNEKLKPFDISPTQYNALRILRGASEAGLTCSEIAERMLNRDPDITRLLDRLLKRGLVRRGRDKKDRRVITAHITDLGLSLLKELDGPVEDFNRRTFAGLGQQKLVELLQVLESVREKL